MKVETNIIMKVELTLSAIESRNECDNLISNEYDNEFGKNLIFDNYNWNGMRGEMKM